MADASEYEATAYDYVQHGLVVLIGCVCLVVLSPVLVPLYVLGRFAARWCPVEDPTADYNSVDGYW